MNRTPLLLLSDMMCDARLWAPQIAALSGRRSLALVPITAHDSVDALAHEVLVNAPVRFALAGLSMGGAVAMEVVRRCPERVTRLALLDTDPSPDGDEARALRSRQAARALAGGLADVARDLIGPQDLAEGPRRDEILDLVAAMALDLGPEVFGRQSRAMAGRGDQRAALAAWRGPTLILAGAQDRGRPREWRKTMRALAPKARLVVVDGAGRLPTLEQPHATTAALADWLEA